MTNLRGDMPHTAAFIDAMRAEFGAAGINDAIRRGMKGEAGQFWARENGHEVGARDLRRGVRSVLEKPVVIGKAKRG